jgi:xylulokinase
MDQRSADIVARLHADKAACSLLTSETSNDVSTTYSALHIKWVQENQPEIWSRVEHILVAKDYLKYRITGRRVTDYAEASGTLLFNVAKQDWSQPAFDLFAIPRRMLPEVLPCDEIIGHVQPEISHLTGIPAGTPMVNGSSDNTASALGAGMVQPGQVTLIIGTAGVISVCSDRPLADERRLTLCWNYSLRDHWAILGIMQTAGASLEWFKNAFDPQTSQTSGDIFDQYNAAAQAIPEGSDGLIFLPYLNGERTPYWDSDARGVFFGVNLKTEKAHFIRAVMEGVSFGLRNNLETVESLGIKINEVRAVGGGLKSPVWLDILAKILRKPVYTVTTPDTGNLGNILMAGKAIGLYPDYARAVHRMVAVDQVISCPDGSPVYEKQYRTFLDLYRQLQPVYRQAAKPA